MKLDQQNKVLLIFSIFSLLFLIFGIMSGFNYGFIVNDRLNLQNENPYHVDFNYINASLAYLNFTIFNNAHFSLDFTQSIIHVLYYNETSKKTEQFGFAEISPYDYSLHSVKIKAGQKFIFSTKFVNDNVAMIKDLNYLVTNNQIKWVISAEFGFVFSNFPNYYTNPNYGLDPIRYYLTYLVTVNIYYNQNTSLEPGVA